MGEKQNFGPKEQVIRLTSFGLVPGSRGVWGNGGSERLGGSGNKPAVVMDSVRRSPGTAHTGLFMILWHLPPLPFLTFVFSLFQSRRKRNTPAPRPLTSKLSSQQRSPVTAPRSAAFPLGRGRFEKQKIY